MKTLEGSATLRRSGGADRIRPVLAEDGVELYQGDCRLVMKQFPAEIADAIVVDPSYGLGWNADRKKGQGYWSNRALPGSPRREINTPLVGDDQIDTSWLPEAARLLKDGGAMYLFTRWDVAGDWIAEIGKCLVLKNRITWVKANHSAGDLHGNYGFVSEDILFAVKGRHLPLWSKRERNLWTDWSKEPRVHPTQKPLAVVAHCIINSCPVGGTILDPMCGSGTTLLAARGLGCRAIGIEIDPKWTKVAIERLRE